MSSFDVAITSLTMIMLYPSDTASISRATSSGPRSDVGMLHVGVGINLVALGHVGKGAAASPIGEEKGMDVAL